MKAKVYDTKGKQVKDITLPDAFNEPIRTDLINRASLAILSSSYQAKGTFPRSGLQTTARYVGRRRAYHALINRGMARLPRVLGPKGHIGEVRRVSHSRGGRIVHGPKTQKKLKEEINKKEKRKAFRSALSATTITELVTKRGHKTEGIKTLPIILQDEIENITKTKDMIITLKNLGLEKELERTQEKRIRAGKGTMRGRKYKKKKGVLIVTGTNAKVYKAARNIPGTDICTAKELNTYHLAPGGQPGRLTIYTESAIQELQKRLE